MGLEGSNQQARPGAEMGDIRVRHPVGMESVKGESCLQLLRVVSRVPGLRPPQRDLRCPSGG